MKIKVYPRETCLKIGQIIHPEFPEWGLDADVFGETYEARFGLGGFIVLGPWEWFIPPCFVEEVE